MALEEWKLRLTSAKVEVKVEAELGNNFSFRHYLDEYYIPAILSDGCRDMVIVGSSYLHNPAQVLPYLGWGAGVSLVTLDTQLGYQG